MPITTDNNLYFVCFKETTGRSNPNFAQIRRDEYISGKAI